MQVDEFLVAMTNRPIDITNRNVNVVIRDAIDIDVAGNGYRCILRCCQITGHGATCVQNILMQIEHQLWLSNYF